MKKECFLLSLLVISLLTLSVAMAFWPFTGYATAGPTKLPASTLSCSESDGSSGPNETIAGAIQYTYKSTWTSYSKEAADFCENNASLTEYYCAGKLAKSKVVRCNGGCDNETVDAFGKRFNAWKCLPEGPEIPPEPEAERVCNDSDAGPNATIAGVVVGENELGSFAEKDQCVGIATIKEMACTEDKMPKAITLRCAGDAAGKCNTTSVTFSGSNYTGVGFCKPAERQCSDSDGARNYTVAGVAVAVVNALGNTKTARDMCVGKKLREVYCLNNTITTEDVDCPAGTECIRGACAVNPLKAAKCEDSDGGLKPDVAGNVTLHPSEVKLSDFCLNSKYVMEFGCYGWGKNSTVILPYMVHRNCPYGCSNGMCRPKPAVH
jgi:hypothetical protein